jgi:hypothetical protein
MTGEILELLAARPEWYADTTKRIWQPDELAYTYVIYNLYYGENRRDSGCGSCRRSVIAHVRKLYENFVLEKKQNTN